MGIPVELGDELPGGFEADAWDVGPGGVGLRSAFLPRIGSRLHCRFRNPQDGTPIEARGEVVWADEAGPHEGSFGLRFESLDGRSAEELDRLLGRVATIDGGGREMLLPEPVDRIAELGADQAADQAADQGVQAQPGAAESEPELPEESGPRLVQISLEGVAQGLTAELVHESRDVVLLEQSLDFLRLDRRVHLQDGREGLVAAVEVRVEGDTPRLVMTLALDPREDTRADAEPAFEERAPHMRDEAVAEVSLQIPHQVAHQVAPEPQHRSQAEPARAAQPAGVSRPAAAPPPRVQEYAEGPQLEPVAEPAEAAHFTAWVDRPSDRPAPEKSPAELLRETIANLAPHVARLRALFAAFVAKALPICERFFHSVRAKAGSLGVVALSSARGAASRGATRARRFGDALPRTLAEKRGNVRLPTRRPQRVQVSSRVPLEARSKSRTQLIVGIGVLFALLFGIGLLVRGDEAAVEAPAAAAEEPTASAEVHSSSAFGAAEVKNAMIFDLVLESAAQTLEGSQIEDGVQIRIPGGRSVSRAGAIAANHPDVEYAAIRNLDGEAELEIRFVPGREPLYRVELRGSIVRVSIAP